MSFSKKNPYSQFEKIGILVMMSPHTCIIFPSKPTKKDKRKKKEILSMQNKKVNELHMKTKCPKQLGHLLGEEDHCYVPHPKIKPIGTPKMRKPSLTKVQL
jgi:hypothetical protein